MVQKKAPGRKTEGYLETNKLERYQKATLITLPDRPAPRLVVVIPAIELDVLN